MEVKKGNKVVEVTERAYNIVYAPLGYKPIKEQTKTRRTVKKADKDESGRAEK